MRVYNFKCCWEGMRPCPETVSPSATSMSSGTEGTCEPFARGLTPIFAVITHCVPVYDSWLHTQGQDSSALLLGTKTETRFARFQQVGLKRELVHWRQNPTSFHPCMDTSV